MNSLAGSAGPFENGRDGILLGATTWNRSEPGSTSALLFRVGDRTCALDLLHVLEIMRPLPVADLVNAPGFVSGLSMIRGLPTPVVSLALLLAGRGAPPGRFVLVRAAERQVALAVDEVLGVFQLDPVTLKDLPPLVQDSAAGVLEAVGVLDSRFLFVLNSAGIVPGDVWQRMVPQS